MSLVYCVEDDIGIRELISCALKSGGYEVCGFETGRELMENLKDDLPSLILLDVMLPELSGLEVLRRIRKTSSVPVIMVSARGETYDKVNGLDAGADDYIAKPFEIEELLARLRAVIRRSDKSNAEGKTYSIGNLILNTESMEVTNSGELIELSKTEYLLLKCLLANIDVVLSRDSIIDQVWGEGHSIDVNAVDVYVRYLRSKLGEGIISTVRGAGYVIRSEQKN